MLILILSVNCWAGKEFQENKIFKGPVEKRNMLEIRKVKKTNVLKQEVVAQETWLGGSGKGLIPTESLPCAIWCHQMAAAHIYPHGNLHIISNWQLMLLVWMKVARKKVESNKTQDSRFLNFYEKSAEETTQMMREAEKSCKCPQTCKVEWWRRDGGDDGGYF